MPGRMEDEKQEGLRGLPNPLIPFLFYPLLAIFHSKELSTRM